MRLGERAIREPCARTATRRLAIVLLAGAALAAAPAPAIQIVGYDASINDRFLTGFPELPTPNTGLVFVGLPYDLAGIAWSSLDATKGFGFLSPLHYLVATHYGGAAEVGFLGDGGTVSTVPGLTVIPTGLGFPQGGGDLSIGRLAAPVPAAAGLPRYAVLDLNATSASDTPAAYAGRPVLVSGRGTATVPPGSPRLVASEVATAASTLYGANTGYMLTTTADFTLETGDSGSPLFVQTTNPNGQAELAIIGNHAAVDRSLGNNIHNFLGRADVMNAVAGIMAADGLALRITGTVRATWSGGASTSIGSRAAWGLSRPAQPPADAFVLFDAAAADSRVVTVDAARELRGLFFRSTPVAGDGFTFGGAATLTIGRGGIVNYDGDHQVFTAPLALADHQHWDVGPGGITTAALATRGSLLEIAGSGTTILGGVVSGSGAVSVSGPGTVILGAVADHTGPTRLFGGTLELTPEGGLAGTPLVDVGVGAHFDVSALERYLVPAGQMLGGEGTVVGSVVFGAGSTLSPGRSTAPPPPAAPLPAAAVMVPEPAAAIPGVGVLAALAVVRVRRRPSRSA